MLSCTACSLHNWRHLVVPGHGNPDADIALIGEAPGRVEDEQGKPLVGPAGQRFNRQLLAAGIDRAAVWCGNLVLCRPPDNRLRDYPDARARCPDLWLWPALAAVKPRVVVAMGEAAGSLWFPGRRATEISKLARMCQPPRSSAVGWGAYVVVGSFHPSYALRAGGDWNDIDDLIVARMLLARELAERGY